MLSPALRPEAAEAPAASSPALVPKGALLSPPLGPKRRRLASDDEGSFLLADDEAARVQQAIQASLQADMSHRLGCSLQDTSQDLQTSYPEETKDGFHRARQRAASELTDFARSREATPMLGPQRPQLSPGLGIALPPACSPTVSITLPPPMELPEADVVLPPAAEKPEMEAQDLSQAYSHDGLLDHEQLMMAIYASQGLDFAALQGQAQRFLEEIGLRPYDMGVMNVDEGGNTLINQCFYLSLARGYLGQEATWPDASEMALRLKRAIEAAVLAERPNWAGATSEVGNEAMAFADFLPLAMKANSGDGAELNVLAELAVCVLDSTAGHVDVYLGSKYMSLEDMETKERNLVLLWYTPGHYQCLVVNDEIGSKVWMSYERFKTLLSEHGVVYIETLE